MRIKEGDRLQIYETEIFQPHYDINILWEAWGFLCLYLVLSGGVYECQNRMGATFFWEG